MIGVPEVLSHWLGEGGAPAAVRWAKLAFLALAALAWAGLLRAGRAGGRPPAVGGRRGFVLVLALLFGAVFAHQGAWQLAGFANPKFLQFMRRYDRRPGSSASLVSRGRILDARGVELAANDPVRPMERVYPLGRECGHVVGYYNPYYGLAGVEAADDARLSGIGFGTREDLDRFGRGLLNHAEARGGDLVLTLDARLQAAATSLMEGRSGAVVALRPSDGAVLALVSAPAYDPNDLGDELAAPRGADAMFNRALQGLYPAGSIVKIVLAAAALESGFRGRLPCPAEGFAAERGARPIRDHEYYVAAREGRTWSGHGRIDLREAFRMSSNVYFAQLAVRLGSAHIDEIAARFGFNRPAPLFAGSTSVLAAKASEWPVLRPTDRRELAQTGIGQGRLLVTPLQAALLAAAVASGGEAVAPRLTAPREAGAPRPRILAPEIAAELRRLMRDAVEHGTGQGADLAGLEVAGKTGTAQNPQGEDHSWFVCFAPASRPAIVLAVLVEHGGYGSASAVPVAAKLLAHARRLGLLEAAGAAPAGPAAKAGGGQ